MKFKELDSKLRAFESVNDFVVLPNLFIVARIDGRNFTRLTKETLPYERPFDVRFRDHMIATVSHLMSCGFRVVYGYTQSDEISLLLHRDDQTFGRKLRKLNSVFAGEASAKFSTLLGSVAAFDCRISQLPSIDLVVDYFRWRHEDAHRNALNAHCYWTLRKLGEPARDVTEKLSGMSIGDKNELLYQTGKINFNDLPGWQKRGTGVYWEAYQKESVNPKTGKKVYANRKRLNVDMQLLMKAEYSAFVRALILKEH